MAVSTAVELSSWENVAPILAIISLITSCEILQAIAEIERFPVILASIRNKIMKVVLEMCG
jgi:hypothetical protein